MQPHFWRNGRSVWNTRTPSSAYAFPSGVPARYSYGLRNEIAPWRSSAPQPLSFTPREQAVVDHGFLLSDNHSGRQKLLTFNSFPASALRLGLGMQMTRAGRPQVFFDLSPLWW